jgi:hypothetical protein
LDEDERASLVRPPTVERGRPWQNFIETHLNVQRRMGDWHFAKAGSWLELIEAHERFAGDYNAQAHFALEGPDDGRGVPSISVGPCVPDIAARFGVLFRINLALTLSSSASCPVVF